MNRSNPLALLAALSAVFAACDKKDPEPDKAALLTAKKWRISGLTTTTQVNNGQLLELDVFETVKPCERDNFQKFNADQTVVADQGATKCDNAEPQSVASTWAFESDKFYLVITTNGQRQSYKLKEISANKLVLSYDTADNGRTTTRTTTMTAFE